MLSGFTVSPMDESDPARPVEISLLKRNRDGKEFWTASVPVVGLESSGRAKYVLGVVNIWTRNEGWIVRDATAYEALRKEAKG